MSHNPIRPWRNIDRRKSRRVMVGSVPVGDGAPISVQELSDYWRKHGEDPFIRSWRDHVLLDESAAV